MSEIDQFMHKCIGFIHCPTDHDIVYGNGSIKEIPIYQLEERSHQWNAKAGDLLIGGGRGEAAVLRVSIPEAIFLFTHSEWDNFKTRKEIFQAFWNPNQAFIFCDGYSKLGWSVSQPIEAWLAEHVVAFLIHSYSEKYRHFIGDDSLELDGMICRTSIVA